MNLQTKNEVLKSVVEKLELPETAYQQAEERYKDIGIWLARDGSTCAKNDPHIFLQGSFRLGTAIRPLDEKEEYDLDLSCKLQVGITTSTHSQKALKDLLGNEIEAYRKSRGIKEPKEEKHRCWRLYYADKLSFHIDIVPDIPANQTIQKRIFESMRSAGKSEFDSEIAAKLAVFITDNRHPQYGQICQDWQISNPEGYAHWFETRMKQGQHVILAEKAKIDDVPIYTRKTPLQRIIQLLKRHRDLIFKDVPDFKPISIIITTLAAEAYQGESDIESALKNILSTMGNHVRKNAPRIPNPVDPNEDFADRWSMPEGRQLRLEENFWNWLRQAQVDFDLITSSDNTQFLSEQAKFKFNVNIDSSDLAKRLGLEYQSIYLPKSHPISGQSPKPWSK